MQEKKEKTLAAVQNKANGKTPKRTERVYTGYIIDSKWARSRAREKEGRPEREREEELERRTSHSELLDDDGTHMLASRAKSIKQVPLNVKID